MIHFLIVYNIPTYVVFYKQYTNPFTNRLYPFGYYVNIGCIGIINVVKKQHIDKVQLPSVTLAKKVNLNTNIFVALG